MRLEINFAIVKHFDDCICFLADFKAQIKKNENEKLKNKSKKS
jgi:hypothetical protein